MGERVKTPMDAMLEDLDWVPLHKPGEIIRTDDPSIPFATHRGVLRIGDLDLVVYQLNTGQRVIEQESLLRYFGIDPTEASR